MAQIEKRDNSVAGLEPSDARAYDFDGASAIRGRDNGIDGGERVGTLQARLASHARG